MGPNSKGRLFIDSLKRQFDERLRDMARVYSIDPTPALKERIERERVSSSAKIKRLRDFHEKFEKLMSASDEETRIINLDERSEPLYGDPVLVRKIKERKMGREEYFDLLEGPDINKD